MRKLLPLFFCLLLLPSCLSFEVSLNKTLFHPGEERVYTITLDEPVHRRIVINRYYEGEYIRQGQKWTDHGFKELRRTISITNRPGEYTDIFYLDTVKGEKIEHSYTLLPRKPAAFSLRLVEPQETLKNQPFTLLVELSRGALPVENALVYCWLPDGGKLPLDEEGEGLYATSLFIPPEFEGQEFPLEFYAIESEDALSDWGMQELAVKIKALPLEIEFLEPLGNTYAYNQPFEASFRVVHPQPELVTVQMKQGNALTALRAGEDGRYSIALTELQTMAPENTPITFSLIAFDRYGNKVEEEFSFEQEGYLFWYWKRQIFYVIFPAVFILYLMFLSVKQFQRMKAKRRKKAEKKRQR